MPEIERLSLLGEAPEEDSAAKSTMNDVQTLIKAYWWLTDFVDRGLTLCAIEECPDDNCVSYQQLTAQVNEIAAKYRSWK